MENSDFLSLLKNDKFYVEYDEEYNKDWSNEILLSHIMILRCEHIFLADLPNLINCQILDCSFNLLIKLPNLPNCKELYCNNNLVIDSRPLFLLSNKKNIF